MRSSTLSLRLLASPVANRGPIERSTSILGGVAPTNHRRLAAIVVALSLGSSLVSCGDDDTSSTDGASERAPAPGADEGPTRSSGGDGSETSAEAARRHARTGLIRHRPRTPIEGDDPAVDRLTTRRSERPRLRTTTRSRCRSRLASQHVAGLPRSLVSALQQRDPDDARVEGRRRAARRSRHHRRQHGRQPRAIRTSRLVSGSPRSSGRGR